MKNVILFLFFLSFSLNLLSQSEIVVKIYDDNYNEIDFNKKELLPKYKKVYIDTGSLDFAPIDRIPEEILLLENLTSVKFTILSDSNAVEIFSVLKKIDNLEELAIDGNNLNVKGIFEPEKYNCLIEFPPEINELVNLKILKLNGHLLTQVIIDTDKLLNLKRIELFRNKITKFPEPLCLLPKLKYLGLENNYIDTLPPDICEKFNIESLMIGRNSLRAIPLCFFNNSSLKEFYINENFISEEKISHYKEYISSKEKRIDFYAKGQKSIDSYPKYDPSIDVILKILEENQNNKNR